MSRTRLLIVGSGYTGSHLYASAKKCGLQVSATSRHPDQNLSHIDPDDRLFFDLEKPSTWSALPPDCSMIWCFPARPLALVQGFAEIRRGTFPRLIVLGSTAAYNVNVPEKNIDRPPPWLDESAVVDHSLPRVQGEEYLRSRHGAMVLRVAGIYGPGRNPLDWIRQGRVGISDRYVNLIHVADLAGICLALLSRDTPGEVYNVTDGTARTWAEICELATNHWRIIPRETRERGAGKRISNRKLQARLNYAMQCPDLFEALAAIEPPLGHLDHSHEDTSRSL